MSVIDDVGKDGKPARRVSMRVHMRRSFLDTLKGLFYAFGNSGKDSEPVKTRVENARMTHSRLKALKPLDANIEQKVATTTPAKSAAVDPNDPATISKRITTLAHMSHYRLEALKAVLPSEPEDLDDFAVRA